MEWPFSAEVKANLKTLGRGLVSLGVILLLIGFMFSTYLISNHYNDINYDEWPLTFGYIPMAAGLIMIVIGTILWHQRRKMEFEFNNWLREELMRQRPAILEIDGERVSFDPELGGFEDDN